MHTRGLPLYLLAWGCALLPFLTSHVSYLIAAWYGHVEWCIPYWDSCTSISATGRQLPEKLWFKLGMLPAALLTALYWWCLRTWLLDTPLSQNVRSLAAMAWIGILAAFFLMLYTVALGEEGDAYQRIRRIGVTLSFALTYLAQLLFTHQLGQLGRSTGNPAITAWYRRLLVLLMVLLGVGIGSLVLDAMMGSAYDAIEDAFEWSMALLLNAWFAGTALLLGRLHVVLHIAGDKNQAH